jgi:hypothetical protein
MSPSPGEYSDLYREDERSLFSIEFTLSLLFNREVLGSLPQYKQRNLAKHVRSIHREVEAIRARHGDKKPDIIEGTVERPAIETMVS